MIGDWLNPLGSVDRIGQSVINLGSPSINSDSHHHWPIINRQSATVTNRSIANHQFRLEDRNGRSGRHFLQIPGPTNVPDRILRALSQPTMDHRGPTSRRSAREVFTGSSRSSRRNRPGRHLSGLRHRRVGSLAGEHALARRRDPDVRNRAFRDAVERSRDSPRVRRSTSSTGDWHHGVRPRWVYAKLADDRAPGSRPSPSYTTRPRPAP